MTSKRSNTASAKGRDIAPGVPAQKGSVMEEVVRVPLAPGSREPSPTVSAASGFDPSRCANCEGIGWVCENHPDRPWEGLSAPGEGCDCGAGAPCPVCQPAMALSGRLDRTSIARIIALHGLGTVDGLLHREPPNSSWTVPEWERRILDCVPTRVERQCYGLADEIIAFAIRDSDASLAEDAKRLSPEGVAARAEGIAKGDAA